MPGLPPGAAPRDPPDKLRYSGFMAVLAGGGMLAVGALAYEEAGVALGGPNVVQRLPPLAAAVA